MEKIAEKLHYDFSGVYKPQNDKDTYGLSYADFVPSLVKALQELSEANEAKDAKLAAQDKINADLQNQINDLKIQMAANQQSINKYIHYFKRCFFKAKHTKSFFIYHNN